jgi:tellurite resistance protein
MLQPECPRFTNTMISSPANPSTSAAAGAVVMDPSTAFAAVALAAVSWDGVLTMAGSRALRHSLDYRQPFRRYGQDTMVKLMDTLLAELRRVGPQHLMVEAAEQLSPSQRATAFAVAAEIMRSDGPLQDDERNILTNLAITLELTEAEMAPIMAAMDLLHADVLEG